MSSEGCPPTNNHHHYNHYNTNNSSCLEEEEVEAVVATTIITPITITATAVFPVTSSSQKMSGVVDIYGDEFPRLREAGLYAAKINADGIFL